jgi:hypothetical protein
MPDDTEQLRKQVAALTKRVQRLERRVTQWQKIVERMLEMMTGGPGECRRREPVQRGHLSVVTGDVHVRPDDPDAS